jgi:O-antigen/teichoic acid export membrane protein
VATVSLRPLLRRLAHYGGGTAVGLLTGMISYPLFTRVLAVEDYGIMGLIQLILLGGVAVAKLGLQHAVVRFWPARDHGPEARAAFATTFFVTALGLGAAGAVVCLVLTLALRSHLPPRLVLPLAVAALLIPVRTLFSFAQNFLRARERSGTFAWTSSLAGVLGVSLAVAFVLGVTTGPRRLVGLYLGLVIAETIGVAIALRAALAGTRLAARRFDRGLWHDGLRFGAPLLLFELAAVVLRFGDRVVLEIFRSERELGFYTAAFGLAWQLAALCVTPLELAVVPAFTAAWEHEGPAATSALVARVHRLYALVVLPAIAGLWAVRHDLMTVLASHRYAAAGALVPLLFAGFVLAGSRAYVGAGLFLAKQSRTAGLVALGGAALNVALNLAVVPRFGAAGSAVVNTVASLAMVAVLGWCSRRTLRFDLALGRLLLYAAGAAGMAAVVVRVNVVPAAGGDFGAHLVQLLLRVLLGAAIWTAFAVVVEPAARAAVVARLGRRRVWPARALLWLRGR